MRDRPGRVDNSVRCPARRAPAGYERAASGRPDTSRCARGRSPRAGGSQEDCRTTTLSRHSSGPRHATESHIPGATSVVQPDSRVLGTGSDRLPYPVSGGARGTTRTASVPPPARSRSSMAAAQLARCQGTDDLQAQPVAAVEPEVLAAAPAGIGDASRAAACGTGGPTSTTSPSSPGTKPCSTALSSSSLSTIASGVAISAGSTPNGTLPPRCDLVVRRRHLDRGGATRSTISSNSTASSTRHRQRLVHQRDRGDPADRLLQRRPRRPAHPPGLQPQQRRHGLQVVLHPVVDLPDRGVLGHQCPVPAAYLGDVPDQHQRADRHPGRHQRQGPHQDGRARGPRPPCAPAPRPAARPGSARPRRCPPAGRRRAGRSAPPDPRRPGAPASPIRRYADWALGLA